MTLRLRRDQGNKLFVTSFFFKFIFNEIVRNFMIFVIF